MHRLYDNTQHPSIDVCNDYNHSENGENYRLRVVGGKIEAEIWDSNTETYNSVNLSETREANWLALINLVESGNGNDLPLPGDVSYKAALKVITANDPTVEALSDKVRVLEAENAKHRQALKDS